MPRYHSASRVRKVQSDGCGIGPGSPIQLKFRTKPGMHRQVNARQRYGLAVSQPRNVEIRGTEEALLRRMSVRSRRFTLAGAGKAEIGLAAAESVAGNHEARLTPGVGPDVPMSTGIIVQLRPRRK